MADDVKIVMFCCNWCSYGGADTAGTARMQYPPNIRVIRVMCSGRIDPQFVLKAFQEGADGVFVAGCHMGDCHYDAGNYKLDRRMINLQISRRHGNWKRKSSPRLDFCIRR